jgi:hypothetical protein
VARSTEENFQFRNGVLLITAAALFANVIILGLFRASPPSLVHGDTPAFIAQARHPWAHGLEPPGYPLFLSVFLPLGARGIVVMQALISFGSALFTYSRAKKLGLALAIATCPFLIIFHFQLLTEVLACHLVWVGLVLLAWPKRKWEPIFAGVLFGLAALTRDTLYLMPILLVLLTIRTRFFKAALLAGACAFLTVLPWQVAHHSLKISDGRGGFALWIGTWERNADWQLPGIANAAWPPNAFRSDAERQRVVQAIAAHDEGPLTEVAIDRIRSEPVSVLKTWALRYPRLWVGTRADSLPLRFERGSFGWYTTKLAFFGLNLAVLALALVGAWRLRRDPVARLIGVPIAYLGVILIPFHNTEPRYSLPAIIPLLFLAGGAFLGNTSSHRNGSP